MIIIHYVPLKKIKIISLSFNFYYIIIISLRITVPGKSLQYAYLEICTVCSTIIFLLESKM
jgi:hypothetical protein